MYGRITVPKKHDYITYTTEEMSLISDSSLTAKEISNMIGVSEPTIHRARKRLNIKVAIGAKKNKPNPNKERKENIDGVINSMDFNKYEGKDWVAPKESIEKRTATRRKNSGYKPSEETRRNMSLAQRAIVNSKKLKNL